MKEQKFGKGIIIGILIGLALAGVVFAVVKVSEFLYYKITDTQPIRSVATDRRVAGKIKAIEDLIDENFYKYDDEVTDEEIEEGIYRGMVASLNDPYSEYYSEAELKEEMDDMEGVAYGIGVVVSVDEEKKMPIIVSIIEGSPAEEADIEVGDYIYEVEGESTYDMSLSHVVSLVRGAEGTKVNITMYRESTDEKLNMDVERREVIQTTSVVYGFLKDDDGNESKIGYIDISEFDNNTVDQFAEAMAELKAKEMEGLILDLRYNLGGNVNAVVEISRMLLPEGIIVYTEDKNGKKVEYSCDGEKEIEVPMVVLVNEYTASASEILSGAIQDYNKGTIVGTVTYGKGVVQRIIGLDDGSAVKLTISAYFTPSGRNIQKIGIEPDVKIEFDKEQYDSEGIDNQLEEGLRILKEKIG